MTPSSVARLALAGAVVLAWVAAPVTVVAVLSREADQVRFATDEAAWVGVRAVDGAREQRLGLALSWEAGPTLVAPAWDGVVEVRHLAVGDEVRSGDAVVVVAGVTRVAHAGERPVTRLLVQGDRGPDVAVLHGLLAERGLAHGAGDRFTAVTGRGVRALAEQLGAGRTEQFDPSWVLHMSAPVLTVADLDLDVGAPAPDVGAPVVTGAAVLLEARVTSQEWAARAATLAGEQDTSAVPAVGDEARSVAPDAELRVGGAVLPLVEARDEVDAAGLPAVTAAVDRGAVAVDAVAVSPPVPGSWAVASAAVRSGPDGSTSVRRQRDGRDEEVAVTVVGADGPSTTVVVGDLDAADRVEVPAGGGAAT
ncbi:hypothetical protein [Cellulomonas triticagri]|uniref:hypothetical protein n=1 Tax=Cellulomonas triticagri TaxID=2483352 RepID=UPI0011C3B659|nr:hypothetical protein [Cellulomonas triticagri]